VQEQIGAEFHELGLNLSKPYGDFIVWCSNIFRGLSVDSDDPDDGTPSCGIRVCREDSRRPNHVRPHPFELDVDVLNLLALNDPLKAFQN
jgi:hypothetical protein